MYNYLVQWVFVCIFGLSSRNKCLLWSRVKEARDIIEESDMNKEGISVWQ